MRFQQKQAGRGGAGARPDLPVPVLAATPRMQDVPVYLDAVGSVRALNTVTVRSQVDGKLIKVNFVEGQDVKQGDVLGEIDPVIYQAQYDQAVAKKAQDEALLANQKLDLARYQQLAASNAGSKQQADTQRAVVAQQEALVQGRPGRDRQCARRCSAIPRSSRRCPGASACVRSTRATSSVLPTPPASSSSPSCSRSRCSSACRSSRSCGSTPPPPRACWRWTCSAMTASTVVDTGTLKGIDNQVDPTTGTLKLKAEFPNAKFQLWPGQFVNVRLKVETLRQGDRGADLGGTARPCRHIQLRDRRRQCRDREAGRGDAAERDTTP